VTRSSSQTTTVATNSGPVIDRPSRAGAVARRRTEAPVVATLFENALIQAEHGPDTLASVECAIVKDG
jgi:hypothetical protein